MKKLLSKLAVSLFVLAQAMIFAPGLASAATPNWNVSGSYVTNINYQSVDYPENLVLTQVGSSVTGTLALLDNSSPWTIDTGSVSGNSINLEGYLNSSPTWRVNLTGTIAIDGSMSGTWADITVNNRTGTWATTSGVAKQTQTCSTINLVSGTNTKTAGYTETTQANAQAALNKNHYSGLGVWTSAFATQAVIPPWIDPSTDSNFTGAVWISTAASNQEASSTADQWRLFEDSFKLPEDAVVSSATLAYTADNAASVYLNGKTTAISSTLEATYGSLSDPNTDAHTYGTMFNQTFNPKEGNNKLDFVVRNLGGNYSNNPTGLLYKVIVNYCVPIHKGDKDDSDKDGNHGDKDNSNHDLNNSDKDHSTKKDH